VFTPYRLPEFFGTELAPFRGDLIVLTEGVQDAQSQTSLPCAISRENDRVGSGWAQTRRVGQRVGLSRHQHAELGAYSCVISRVRGRRVFEEVAVCVKGEVDAQSFPPGFDFQPASAIDATAVAQV